MRILLCIKIAINKEATVEKKNERKEKIISHSVCYVKGTGVKNYLKLKQVCFCFHFASFTYGVHSTNTHTQTLFDIVENWNIFLPFAFSFKFSLMIEWYMYRIKSRVYNSMRQFPKGFCSTFHFNSRKSSLILNHVSSGSKEYQYIDIVFSESAFFLFYCENRIYSNQYFLFKTAFIRKNKILKTSL